MATLVLGILGAVVIGVPTGGSGAGIGFALGAAVGGVVDSQILFPALFPPDDIVAGRVGEIDVQSGSEGSPMAQLAGPECRTAGTVIYVSDLKERKRSETVGGKGGRGQTIARFVYFVDIAVAVGRGPINALKRVFADGKLIWKDTISAFFLGEGVSVRPVLLNFEQDILNINLPIEDFFVRVMDIRVAQSTFDFTIFRASSNKDCVVGGFSNPENNGTFAVLRTWNDQLGTSYLRLGNPNAKLETQSQAGTVSITQLQPKFDTLKLSGVTFYPGDETQDPDPTLEADLGAGQVPAYRGQSYVVITDLALEFYGNRVPNFSFVLERDESITVGDTIGRFLELAGLNSSQYDTSTLTEALRGYVRKGLFRGDVPIQGLSVAYNLIAQEANGKLTFKKRTDADVVTLQAEDLAAHEEGSDVQRVVDLGEVSDFRLPSEVSVSYQDPLLDYQKATQVERRRDVIQEVKARVELPLVLTAQQARGIAGRILWNGIRNQQTVALRLPPSYLELLENDKVQFTAYGQQFTAIVQELVRGQNGVIELTGVIEEVSDFTGEPDQDPSEFTQSIGVPASVRVEVIDIAPLRDEDRFDPGFYLAAANIDATESWKGAAVFFGDRETVLEQIAQVRVDTPIGETEFRDDPDVVIQKNTESTRFFGVWQNSSAGDPFSGTARISQSDNDQAIFDVTVPSTGDYEVYFRFTRGANRNPETEILLRQSAFDVARVYVDETDDQAAGTWVNLGRFNLAQTASTFSQLSVIVFADNAFTTSVDALLLIRADQLNVLGAGPIGFFDRKNSVDVRLFGGGTLESRTEEEVLNGANSCAIGGEILSFQDATLNADGTYTLSTLLRGRRDTGAFVNRHKPGERFVLLDQRGLVFQKLRANQVDTRVFVKGVAPGEVEANIEEDEFIARGNNLTAFSPGNFQAKPSAPGEAAGIALSWVSRTSLLTSVFNLGSTGGRGRITPGTGWRIRCFDSERRRRRTLAPGPDDLRTVFSTSEQIAAGFGSGDTIIFQIVRVFGPGRVSRLAETSFTSTV